MLCLRHFFLATALMLLAPGEVFAADAPSAAQAQEDVKLLLIEPYYSRLKLLNSCLQQMMRMSGGTPAERVRLSFGFCQAKSDDLRALLGARIGLARAARVIELYKAKIVEGLIKQSEEEKKDDVSLDDRIAQKSIWSDGSWHVIKSKDRCIAIHSYEASNKIAGLSYAGATPYDIMITGVGRDAQFMMLTPAGPYASALHPYADKTIHVDFSATSNTLGKIQSLGSDIFVKRIDDSYYMVFGPISNITELMNYSQLEIEALDHDRGAFLRGYRYDIRGLEGAIQAYQRCAAG